jgi:hypothetical protein
MWKIACKQKDKNTKRRTDRSFATYSLIISEWLDGDERLTRIVNPQKERNPLGGDPLTDSFPLCTPGEQDDQKR